jgi:protein TonB
MRHRVPLHEFMPYGAPDLQVTARPHLSRALVAASALALASVAALSMLHLGALAPAPPAVDDAVVIDLSRVLLPPPPIDAPPATSIAPPSGAAKTGGEVVPVIDERADPEVTLPSQDDLRADPAIPEGAPGQGSLSAPPVEEPLPGRDDFVHVEELPAPVRSPQPDYPEIARIAQVDGTVLVRALVGRDGRVLDVYVEPTGSVPMLDGAAMDAVRRWVFKPALANGHPVAVWVRIPMRFRLR